MIELGIDCTGETQIRNTLIRSHLIKKQFFGILINAIELDFFVISIRNILNIYLIQVFHVTRFYTAIQKKKNNNYWDFNDQVNREASVVFIFDKISIRNQVILSIFSSLTTIYLCLK